MIPRPPRSTRTDHTLSLNYALPILQLRRQREHVARLQRGQVADAHLEAADVECQLHRQVAHERAAASGLGAGVLRAFRSEEHTSELQSLMRTSYAVFCLKKKKPQRAPDTPPSPHTQSVHHTL